MTIVTLSDWINHEKVRLRFLIGKSSVHFKKKKVVSVIAQCSGLYNETDEIAQQLFVKSKHACKEVLSYWKENNNNKKKNPNKS